MAATYASWVERKTSFGTAVGTSTSHANAAGTAAVVLGWEGLLRGFDEAVARYAAAELSENAADTGLPLLEALNWACIVDERLDLERKETWHQGRPLEGYEEAIRYPRNAGQHMAASLLVWNGEGREWTWRSPAESMPVPRSRRGHAEYVQLFVGQRASDTLARVREMFRDALGY